MISNTPTGDKGMLESLIDSIRRLLDTMTMFASRMDSFGERIQALEPIIERPEDE